MSDFAQRLMEQAARHMNDEEFAAMFSPEGLARQTTWSCEDDWMVSYTTSRIRAGKLDGLFAVSIYKPKGRGRQRVWERVKLHTCDTRKEAKQIATRVFYEHSPKRAAKHGVR